MSKDSGTGDKRTGIQREAEALRSLITTSGLPPQRIPSSQLRERIMAAARTDAFRFVGAAAGLWLPLTPLVRSKELFADSSDRGSTRLLQIDEGGPIPEAATTATRSLFVVQGEVQLAAETLEMGDFVDGVAAAACGRAGGGGALLLEMSPGGSTTQRVSRSRSAVWLSPFPHGRVRPLSERPAGRHEVFVLEMDADSALDEHDHRGLEELFVLHGTCVVEGQPMAKGDYHRAAAGSHHHATATADGCRLLVSIRILERETANR